MTKVGASPSPAPSRPAPTSGGGSNPRPATPPNDPGHDPSPSGKGASGSSGTESPGSGSSGKSSHQPPNSSSTGDAGQGAGRVGSTPPPDRKSGSNAHADAADGVKHKLSKLQEAAGAELTGGGKKHGSTPDTGAAGKPARVPAAPGGGPAPRRGSNPESPGTDKDLAQQQEALGDAFTPKSDPEANDAAARYFGKHDTYIDPKSGIEYDAAYDDESGALKLRRDQVDVSTFDVPGGTDPNLDIPIDAPGRLDSRSPYAHHFAVAPRIGADDSEDGARVGSNDRATAPGSKGAAELSAAPALLSERIVITASGERETEQTYDVPSEAGGIHVQRRATSTYDGKITGGSIERTVETGDEAGTTRTDTTETYGPGGIVEGRERSRVTRTPDGATTTEQQSASFEDGKPTGAQGDVVYRFGPVTAIERTVTEYENGRPSSSTIEQEALDSSDVSGFGPFRHTQAKTATLHLSFDKDGNVVDAEGMDASDGRSELTDMIADHPTAAGQRFAFSQIRRGAEEQDGVRIAPLVTGRGLIERRDGVDLFQEGGRVGQGEVQGAALRTLGRYVHGAPVGMRDTLDHAELVNGRNPNDAHFEQEYDIPNFSSTASGGNGGMTFYSGDTFLDRGTFNHELGHISGTENGAPDEAAWQEAIAADSGVDDQFVRSGRVVRNGGVVPHLDGVSEYADTSYRNSGSENEDWAESVNLWLKSRGHGLVTVRTDDGGTRTGTFEELYPERAAIIEEYYGASGA